MAWVKLAIVDLDWDELRHGLEAQAHTKKENRCQKTALKVVSRIALSKSKKLRKHA